MTNSQSNTRFLLVPKSTTLDDLERPLHTLFHNTCVFGGHPENLNEDRLTLSAAKMQRNDSFWQYKVYADIRGGSLERERQTMVELSKTAIFSAFAHCFFIHFSVKANIIIQYYLLHRRLSTDPKIGYVILNAPEWPFHVKFCFFNLKVNICLFTYMDNAMISMVKAQIIYLVKVTCTCGVP